MHSFVGWKDVTSRHDHLAIADPRIDKELAHLRRIISKQSDWVRQQKQDMTNVNSRFQHLLHVIQTEVVREHQREFQLLSVPTAGYAKLATKIWEERVEAANTVLNTMLSYRLVGRSEEADYLMFCLKTWKKKKKKKPILNSNSYSSFRTLRTSLETVSVAEDSASDLVSLSSSAGESPVGKGASERSKHVTERSLQTEDIASGGGGLARQLLRMNSVRSQSTVDSSSVRGKATRKRETGQGRAAMKGSDPKQRAKASLEAFR